MIRSQDGVSFIPSHKPDVTAGITLGYAPGVHEHELGFALLRQQFGVSGVQPGIVGADARLVRQVPEELRLYSCQQATYLFYCPDSGADFHPEGLEAGFDAAIGVRPEDDVSAAWSNKAFGIRLRNDRRPLFFLERIFRALQMNNALLFPWQTGNPFGSAGPAILIRSHTDPAMLKQMEEADLDYLRLWEVVKETGIDVRLKASDLGQRLSPRWKDDSRTAVMFWVNGHSTPQGNDMGWVSLTGLDDWIAGRKTIEQIVAEGP